MSKDLKVKSGFKPLTANRKVLVVSLEDMEPTTFGSMREATRAIGVGGRVIKYVRNNGKDFVRQSGGRSFRVFSIKWCLHPKCLTAASKPDPLGWPQELQSAPVAKPSLMSQRRTGI